MEAAHRRAVIGPYFNICVSTDPRHDVLWIGGHP
jgi:hypothetical protein